MSFGKAEATALFAALKSHAMSLGLFGRSVITHAPLNAPGTGLSCYITLGPVAPVISSGQAAVSIEVTFLVHVLSPMLAKPTDSVDPDLLGAVSVLMSAYVNDFTLGGLVREVNIFNGLKADPGYLVFEDKPFRAVEITLPVIVNDAWTEVA